MPLLGAGNSVADLKLALRRLAKTPFVTAVSILSLALGIGANAAIYSLLDQMLIRALPVDEPQSLVNLANPGPKPGSQSCGQAGGCDEVFSYAMFRDLESADTGLESVAAHVTFGANLAIANTTVSGQGLFVSGSYFPTLGVRPAMGRLLTPEDDRNIGGHFVAVLSHNYWQRQLGSDPDVLNQALVVNGQSMTIVGVAERGFEGTTLGALPDVFVPITMRSVIDPGWDRFENRRAYWAYLFGRLPEGADQDQVTAQLNTVYRAIINDVEAPLQEGMSEATMGRFRAKEITVEPGFKGQSSLDEEASTPLIMLMIITAVVLLIACANIANLLLARGAARAQEMAVRGSLGGSRGQLLRQLLTESVLLALLGGLASLLVAKWTLAGIGSLLPPDAARTLSLTLSPKVFVFAGILSVATGVLFGLYPALHSTRPDLVTLLRSGAGQPSGSRSAVRFRSSLVTAQIALSVALLASAGLFIKSLVNVSRIDLGLDTSSALTFALSPELNGYQPEDSRNMFDRTLEELAAVPGVTGVTASMVPVLGGSSWGSSVRVQGFESGPDIDSNSRFNAIGEDFFRTMGIALLSGREFTRADGPEASPVVIVNETFTRKFGLPGRDAVGMFMSDGGEELDMQIIGVVEDAAYSDVKDEVPPLFYTPWRQQDGIGFLNFYGRTATDPAPVLRGVPDLIKGLDPNLPVENMRTLDDQAKETIVIDRVIGILAAAFAGLATVLAAIGLFGVLSYTVAQRTQEIGIRMALGAGASSVRGLVLKQVGRMTVLGSIAGILVAILLGRAAAGLLYGFEGFDPLVGVAVLVTIGLVALGAALAPALRASRVDPMVALRYD